MSEGSSIKKVLELIGLSENEIQTYFNITGRGPVMVGEMALLSKVSKEEAYTIAKNLLEKGLVREIPGKTPHYMALPPYVALLNQIHQFKELVQSIQKGTPQLLEERFESIEKQSAKLQKLKEYRDHIQQMKTSLPAQIKSQFSQFEQELEQVKKFHQIKSYIVEMKNVVPEDIIQEFEKMEDRLENIKTEIGDAFETQFRVGALSKMAEKIVSRVISKEFNSMVEYFRNKFVQTTQGMLDQVITQLGSLSDAAGDISTGLDDTFEDIESGLKNTLEDLDSKISTVYEEVTSGIEELKSMFRREIFDTMQQDIISNILNQLELSENTMKEFWKRAKRASMLTFKDVWFVRSTEGMKAQINDSISRVKMRFHIIAPKLEDIDFVAIKNVKSHVNIRISTNFNSQDSNDRLLLDEIEQFPNITIRHYPRENLWSINKDFEEVVVCVVSRNVETNQIEIAGMGSILEEHIKLFAALLEDVWIQSKKMDHIGIAQAVDTTIKQQQSVKPSKIMQEQEEIDAMKKPSMPSEKDLIVQSGTTNQEEYKGMESFSEPLQQSDTPIEPKETPSIQISQLPEDSEVSIAPGSQQQDITYESPRTEEFELSGNDSIETQFNKIINNLENLKATEISQALKDLQNNILETRGYSSVLKQINLSSAQYKNVGGKLESVELEELRKKLNFWKKKLHL